MNSAHQEIIKETPFVSVIITTYNRAEILKTRSLPSALNQDYPSFEVVVVDDCSSDTTHDVVQEFKKNYANLRFIGKLHNRSLAHSRNIGVQHAKGEYVVCLDDDDALSKNFLKETVPIFAHLSDQYGAVTTARIIIRGNAREYALPALENTFYSSIDDGWLIRKSVFSHIMYDDELVTDEDADFGIRFFQRYKAKIITQPLLFKFGHPIRLFQVSNFFSISYPSERRFKGLKRFLERNLSFFEQAGYKNELAFIYRFAGRNYCWGGRMNEGRPFLRKAFQVQPSVRNFLHLMCAYAGATPYRIYWFFETEGVRLIRSLITRRVPSGIKDQLR